MATVEKVVIAERVSRTSDVVPTLFVGLGGCGIRIIQRVQKHLRARSDFNDRFKELTRFAAVDTNINDLELARADVNDIFLVSDFEKEAYAALASGKSFLDEDAHFTQWVPKDYRFRAGDTAGAGQIRIESRLGCYYTTRHTDFLTKMRRLVEELKDHDNGYRRLEPREVRVVIAYSIAGGTGSGACLPIAYVLRDMVAEVGRPTIIGVAVLPSVFDQKVGANKDGTHANGYAALKETEHLMRLGAPASAFFPADGIRFHYNGGAPSKTIVKHKPFDFLYLIDKPERFTVDSVPNAAADGLYVQLFSGLFKEQAGDYDNYTQHQRVLVPHDFADKQIQGFTSFYATYGAAVMVVPTDGIIDYCCKLAALGLMRDNFLRTPPASPVYDTVRRHEKYFTVKSDRGDDVMESDFDRRGAEADKLRDDLFVKRVRLLARAELDAPTRSAQDFSDIFRHGHVEEEAPDVFGGKEIAPEAFGKAQNFELKERFSRRIFQAVFATFRPATAGAPRSIAIVAQAMREAKKAADSVRRQDAEAAEAQGKEEGFVRKSRVYEQASAAAQDSVRQAVVRGRREILRVLENGDGTTMHGFAALRGALFLRESEATLTQRRYAALMLLERLQEDVLALLKDIGDPGEHEHGTIDAEQAKTDSDLAFTEAYRSLDSYFEKLALYETKKFLAELKEHLSDFCKVLRAVDARFDRFAQDCTRSAEELRHDGGSRASAFILDGEALTIESGRRMWDFFFVDRVLESVRGRREKDFQREIANALGIGEGRRHVSPDVLDDLFRIFVAWTRSDIAPMIEGDPVTGRQPLGIREAIQLEIAYKAIYESHRAVIDASPMPIDEIKALVMQHRELVRMEKETIDLASAQNQDYLRDKFRRLIKEKADYLCLYDESRDQQGGVRPDKFEAVVMTAALRAKDKDLVSAIKSASGKEPRFVTEGWTDEQTIVFYTAVLNIPLFVFGRMNEMKDHYHRFRDQRFRSKVLHIDKNWEDALPDLDPEDAFARHQSKLLDDSVMFFAALHAARGNSARRLVRLRDDSYEVLVGPDLTGRKLRLADFDGATDAEHDQWIPLGQLIGNAARQLPEVLEGRKQANRQYFVYRTQLMRGLLPGDLIAAFNLARDWRDMFEDLRTNLVDKGGANERRLKDIDDALHAMLRAAEAMATRLSDESLMSGRFGDAIDAGELDLTTEKAKLAIEQSILAARKFADYIRGLLEDGADDVREPLDAVFFGHEVWGPIDKETLKKRLDQLSGKPEGS